MDETELQYLEKALTNETNEGITKLTYKYIDTQKKEIITNLELPKKTMKELLEKLEDYRSVDEMQELIEGRYLRWIKLTDPENIKLAAGGILCEIKIEDSIVLVLKNYRNRFFQINFDENLIFQHLTTQERIILFAIDCSNK
jgi:hypothetical protein